jgi:broad specificity phosphatase PhoE
MSNVACFYLLRHGLTNDDLPDRNVVSGWLEVPLNSQGRSNAHKAAGLLKPRGITSITSSDTKRALQTAKIVGGCLDLPIIESDRLRSWNMGSMQGMDAEVAKPFLTYFQENPDLRPPKGEKFRQFYNRFKGVWLATISYVKRFPNAHPLLVTHSQDLDIVDWFLDDIEPGGALEFGEGIKPGGILEARIDDEGQISVRKVRA